MAEAFKRIPDCVHNLFSYDPDTGVFTHKNPRKKSNIGKVAGRCSGKYWYVKIHGSEYSAHRVAYFMYHGIQPEQIDHINRNGLDNRITNLRVVTHSENMLNRSLWAPRFCIPKRGRPYWYCNYRDRRIYTGKSVLMAHFHRRMAVVADFPIGIEHLQ